jgi:hypothetical protein
MVAGDGASRCRCDMMVCRTRACTEETGGGRGFRERNGRGGRSGGAERRQREGSGRSVGAQRWSEERRMQSKSVGRVCRVVQGGMERRWYELRGGSSGCCKDTERATGTGTCESLRQESRAQTEGALALGARAMPACATETERVFCCSSSRDALADKAGRQDACRVLQCEGTRSATMRRELPSRQGLECSDVGMESKALSLSPASQCSRQR